MPDLGEQVTAIEILMNRVMRPRFWLLLSLSALLVVAAGFQLDCPRCGLSLTGQQQATARLKNRAEIPAGTDFDSRATLDALLQPGDDRARWIESRAASIEGYIVEVKEAAPESANCYSLARRDAHIALARRLDAPPREHLIVEVTPRLREWAKRQGWDWSAPALKEKLSGHWCRVDGWLFFDSGHIGEAENTAPSGVRNWRGTGWEIHPVTRLEVLR